MLLNCFIGAICLAIYHRSTTYKGIRQPGTSVPHYLIKARDGTWWHFKRRYDIFPPPFCYLLFVGDFCKLSDRKPKPSE